MRWAANRAGVLVGCALALAPGCSDTKSANADNLAHALEPLVAERFCRVVLGQLMTTVPPGQEDGEPFPLIITASGSDDRPDEVQTRAMLESAARDGLLARTTTVAPARRRGYTTPLAPTELVVFTPTERGQAMFRPVKRETGDHRHRPFPGVCMGRGRVDEVVRWTEPADMVGRTITRVTYRYSATDVTDLTPTDMRAELAETKEATATLMRTSDGWRPAE